MHLLFYMRFVLLLRPFCRRASVIVIHGLLAAVFKDVLRRLNGPLKALHQNFPLRLRGHTDDPVDHLRAAARRGAGADLDTGEILCSQMGDDILDAVMAAGGAGGPHPQLSYRQ